jgi:hypothetical protein
MAKTQTLVDAIRRAKAPDLKEAAANTAAVHRAVGQSLEGRTAAQESVQQIRKQKQITPELLNRRMTR